MIREVVKGTDKSCATRKAIPSGVGTADTVSKKPRGCAAFRWYWLELARPRRLLRAAVRARAGSRVCTDRSSSSLTLFSPV